MSSSVVSPTELPAPHDGKAESRLPYPNPGWARLGSFLLALALSGLVVAYPRAIASSVSEVDHGLLSLMMWGIAAGFIHGVGYVPRLTIWRIVFHPFAGWLLMLGGIGLLLSA